MPGIAARRASRSRNALTRRSAGIAASRKNRLATTTSRSPMPRSCIARLRNVRRNSNPPNTSTRVTAICSDHQHAADTDAVIAGGAAIAPADDRSARQPQRRRQSKHERRRDGGCRREAEHAPVHREIEVDAIDHRADQRRDRLAHEERDTKRRDRSKRPRATGSRSTPAAAHVRACRRSPGGSRIPGGAPSREPAAGWPDSPTRSAAPVRPRPSGSTAAAAYDRRSGETPADASTTLTAIFS